jgi:pimeloyl-ACP methyl ester carboxylesterase
MLAGIAAIVIVPYVAAGWGQLPVDDKFRAQAPGMFVGLSNGQIHYQWLGGESDPIIVLLHGVSVPAYVFAQMAGGLVNSGYRVLLFDHFGHGFSDRPTGEYDAEFFRHQMIELLDELALNEPVHVLGYSMGGVIAIDFAAHYPDRLASLTLVAPAGIRIVSQGDSTFVKVLKAPVIGQWLWRIIAHGYFFPEKDADVTDKKPLSDEILHGEPVRQADYEGYFEAMRQIYRNLIFRNRDELLVRINDSQFPVVGIFGDKDETIDIESARVLGDLIPRARVVTIDGATHHLVIHRWQEVTGAVRSTLGAP